MKLPSTKAEAKSLGLKFFFTGRQCKRGHIADRQVSGGMCVVCAKDAGKRWKSEHADRNKATAAAWRLANTEKLRSDKIKWRKANIERCTAKKRVWREANRERERNGCRAWRGKNLEYDIVRVRATQAIRRARKKGAGGRHTAADVQDIKRSQNGKCAYCRIMLVGSRFHVDHIVALARGGTNGRSNLQILCAPCNQAKGSKDPILFAQSLGMML